MRTTTIIFLFLIVLFSFCSKKDDNNDSTKSTKDVIVDEATIIGYKNVLGQDLLDTATQNHFSTDNIHVYYLINGIKTEVNYPGLDYPHNFFISKDNSLNQNFLTIFLETDTTLLELNKNITDTITCVIEKSNSSMIVRKVWYNGILKWDNYDIAREFIIIK